MRLDERFIDELKSRLRPSEVIGRTVKLKRQGREWVGLSPFSKEKSPSFFVNDEKGFFHDFSSGKHGDVIGWLQETERLTFREAVERLAGEAGLFMPAPDPRAAEREETRRGLEYWLEEAARWFEAQLRRQTGDEARAYLDRRGLPEGDWGRFRLGYAPAARTGLKDALTQRGATITELAAAGLLIQTDDGQTYDRFRDRLMFPITDGRGRLISFGGRALAKDAKAKYLNGPETELFHKGSQLYGLAEARRLLAADRTAGLTVVEGYMDVIACQRSGVPAVAPMGTALTEEQMAVVWRHAPTPVLCFDGDGAGKRAAGRAVERALPLLTPERTFAFCSLPGGQDPDDLVRTHGPAALKAALARTDPFVKFLFRMEWDVRLPVTPEEQADLKRRLVAAADRIQHRDLAAFYRRDLLERFAAHLPKRARRPSRGPAPPSAPSPEALASAQALAAGVGPVRAALIEAALDRPKLMEPHLEALGLQGLDWPPLDPFVGRMVALWASGDVGSGEDLRTSLAAGGFGETLNAVAEAARASHAPFLSRSSTLAEAHRQWSETYQGILSLAALNAALEEMSGEGVSDTFRALKADRDALRRRIASREIWGV